MKSRAADFERALLDAIRDPRSRIAAIGVLERYRGATIYLPVPPKAERRQRAVWRMCEAGMARDEIIEAARSRWNVSERTIRRDLAKVLNECPD